MAKIVHSLPQYLRLFQVPANFLVYIMALEQFTNNCCLLFLVTENVKLSLFARFNGSFIAHTVSAYLKLVRLMNIRLQFMYTRLQRSKIQQVVSGTFAFFNVLLFVLFQLPAKHKRRKSIKIMPTTIRSIIPKLTCETYRNTCSQSCVYSGKHLKTFLVER